MPSRHRTRTAIGCLLVLGLIAGCDRGASASFDPGGACTTDGRAAGAYPDLEVKVPTVYMDGPPETLDSGRNCTAANLGALASFGIAEVRFAGATWAFGGERAAVLAIFNAEGLSAESVAVFYSNSAQGAARTEVLAQSTPAIAGRAGFRIDTKTGERTQNVVVWPARDKDVVNVVIANDLPEARIQDAIDAFGGN
jgi:hypothetical protein